MPQVGPGGAELLKEVLMKDVVPIAEPRSGYSTFRSHVSTPAAS